MSTDRELLELGAKAAGIEVKLFTAKGIPVVAIPGGGQESCLVEMWNPLTDDGDALRLAIQLRVSIDHNHPADQSPWVSATADGGRAEKVEEFEDERDRCAATRMAIVRAAAEIGRRMP